MPVIALTQEMGSLAKDVALRMGEMANLQVMRHEVEENVANRMQVPTSLIRRLRGGRAGLRERLGSDPQRVGVYTAEEVFAQALRGNVVMRGWGATMILRPVAHVVSVRITRPFDQRVEWVMDHLGTDDRKLAEAEVRRSDHAHASRMHSQFNVTWGDPLLYDLVINMERIGIETAAQQILAVAARPEFQETPESRAVLEGLALSGRIRAALLATEATAETNVDIVADNGKVTLSGLVVDEAERAEVERIAKTVAGVGNVDNQLHLMSVSRRFTYSKT